MPEGYKYNDLLNAAFDDESILLADLHTLKRYRLACAEIREVDILNQRVKEGLPKRTVFIDMLIQMKEREITHSAVMRRATLTLGVSVGTLIVLVLKTLYDTYTRSSPPP